MRNFLIGLILLLVATATFAGDNGASTLIFIRAESIETPTGNLTKETVGGIWGWKSFMGYLEASRTENGYIQLKPAVGIKHNRFFGVMGLQSDSNGANYINAGGWYLNVSPDRKILTDLRNYWASSEEASPLLELFFEGRWATRRGGKLFLGANVLADHWWSVERDSVLVGPLVGYKFNPHAFAFFRPSRTWVFQEGGTRANDALRLGLELKF